MSSPAASPIATNSLPRQHAVYHKYLVLQSLAAARIDASLAGAFVISSGIGREGMELAMASTIAGAAFLGIEPRPQRLKSALRNCACDFMVNTLDEALRVLKNEIRKRQPVSVGLLGNAAEILPSLVERGVQPDFLSDTSPLPSPAQYLVPAGRRVPSGDTDIVGSGEARGAGEANLDFNTSRTAHLEAIVQLTRRGAVLIDFGNGLQSALPNTMDGNPVAVYHIPANAELCHPTLTATTPGTTETCVRWTTSGFQDLKRFDTLASSLLPGDDRIHRRWLEGVNSCFRRQIPLERVLSLRPEEFTALLQSVQDSLFRNALEGVATLHWQDAEGTMHTLEFAAKPTQSGQDVSIHSAKKHAAPNT